MTDFKYSEYYKKRMREKERNYDKSTEKTPQKLTQPLPVIRGSKEEVLTTVKKEIEKDYNRSWEFLILPKHIKVLKFLIIVLAALLIVFLLYKNFVSSEEFHYFYNIGENNENYLSPAYRVSEKSTDFSSNSSASTQYTYRNLTSSLVYFNIPIPRGSDKVKIEVKFKNDFPNTLMMLGAKDREDWHYQWHTLYNKPIENLTDYYQDQGYYIYKMKPNLENKKISQLESAENIVLASNIELKNKINEVQFSKFTTIINNSLRGGHTFYVYTSGELFLEVKKQDLNWYNGSDPLIIEIYDSGNNLLFDQIIPDDGIITASPNQSANNTQEDTLQLENLPESVYRIDFKNFDGLIKEIKINTDKIVVANNVYLADSDLFFNNTQKNSTLYTQFYRDSKITFKTWHNLGLQKVKINNNTLEVKERVNETILDLQPENYTVISQKNDIIISTPGYFAFNKENYFEPYKNKIIDIQSNKDWLDKDIDYLILDYQHPKPDSDQWLVASTEFDLKDLYYKDKLSMVLNTPHLSNEDYKNSTIKIDWINITVYKPGM